MYHIGTAFVLLTRPDIVGMCDEKPTKVRIHKIKLEKLSKRTGRVFSK